MKDQPSSSEVDSSQGGYGSPAPEAEVPSPVASHRAENSETENSPTGRDDSRSEQAPGSRDPLLEPLNSSDSQRTESSVSKEDLEDSQLKEPLD